MIWIDSQSAFDEVMERLEALPMIAVDTEADSLHSYFDKVCLIQISSADEDYVIDPLQKIDLARFGRILGNSQITKVLHGSDYDLRILNRDFGFTIENLIDTMVCSQMLGYESFGLAALLERHFGLNVDKKHQRADWSMRPLTPEMLVYAALDTHHLMRLAQEVREALVGMGRWEWALEEFRRLEAIRFRDTTEESEPFRKLKGIAGLDRRSLGVVAVLHSWRDGLAQKADRPPFKIIGNDAIIEIARLLPRSQQELARIKPVAAYHRGRYGKTIVDLVEGVMAQPEESLPEKTEPKSWRPEVILPEWVGSQTRMAVSFCTHDQSVGLPVPSRSKPTRALGSLSEVRERPSPVGKMIGVMALLGGKAAYALMAALAVASRTASHSFAPRASTRRTNAVAASYETS